MWPRPDPKSAIPVSEQIARIVRARIASGQLPEGAKLASVRAFAAELLVNPNTVAKVYKELEREGLVLARPGSGVCVAKDAKARSCVALHKVFEDRLRNLFSEMNEAGFTGEALLEIIEAAQDLMRADIES